MNPYLSLFPKDDLGTPSVSHPAPDRQIEGIPEQLTWNQDFTADETVCSGIWESAPGAWKTIKGETWEMCHILSGLSVMECDGQPPVTLKAGDTFIMRPGFVGVWRVMEATRKIYVIKSPRP